MIWIYVVSTCLEENHVTAFCTYNRLIWYSVIFWLHTWNAEDSKGENKKNLLHFCSILIVSNKAWPFIYPKMSLWELINTMITAILISLLWFNFILGSNFLFFCSNSLSCYYHTLPYLKTKEKKIWTKDKIEPQHLHAVSLWLYRRNAKHSDWSKIKQPYKVLTAM